MWDKMETFYYVVKAGSFTKAELVLNKTQSALSRSVILLEERLGHTLLKRHVKGLVLTRKGEEVFRTAQRMVMDMDGMKALLNETSEISGKIKISTTHAIATYILAEPLFQFNQLYPKITFDIYCNDNLIDIIQNEVDIAIRPYAEGNNEIVQEYLFSLRANLYASQKYIDKHGEPKTIEELSKHRFIGFSRPEALPYADLEWFLQFGHSNSKKRNCILRVNSVEMHFKAAESGLGIISSYDEIGLAKKSKLIKILPEFKGPKYKDFIRYPKHFKGLPRIKTLRDFLEKYFKTESQKT